MLFCPPLLPPAAAAACGQAHAQHTQLLIPNATTGAMLTVQEIVEDPRRLLLDV